MSINVSSDAKKILRYFKAGRLKPGDYVAPALLEGLFDLPVQCQAAESELSQLGLLTLGPERWEHDDAKVRSATLSPDGFRFLEENAVD